MIYLFLVSVIWSLSFSLIKGSLTTIDPFLVSFLRLLISFIVFLPFISFNKLSKKLIFHLILLGIVQYGLMYIAYIYSFQFLKAYEIAILTIFTPIFVIFIYDFFIKNFVVIHWLQALLAILGSGIIVYSDSLSLGVWKGILLLQVSNFLFALGQVYYRKIIDSSEIKNQKSVFGIIFFGAVIITGLFSAFNTDFSSVEISSTQWITLLYLGGIASGLGFFLWNFGATKVEIGSLAVFNNLKIPLGVVFSILLLGESVNLIQLGLGSIIIITALFLNNLYITKKLRS